MREKLCQLTWYNFSRKHKQNLSTTLDRDLKVDDYFGLDVGCRKLF